MVETDELVLLLLLLLLLEVEGSVLSAASTSRKTKENKESSKEEDWLENERGACANDFVRCGACGAALDRRGKKNGLKSDQILGNFLIMDSVRVTLWP